MSINVETIRNHEKKLSTIGVAVVDAVRVKILALGGFPDARAKLAEAAKALTYAMFDVRNATRSLNLPLLKAGIRAVRGQTVALIHEARGLSAYTLDLHRAIMDLDRQSKAFAEAVSVPVEQNTIRRAQPVNTPASSPPTGPTDKFDALAYNQLVHQLSATSSATSSPNHSTRSPANTPPSTRRQALAPVGGRGASPSRAIPGRGSAVRGRGRGAGRGYSASASLSSDAKSKWTTSPQLPRPARSNRPGDREPTPGRSTASRSPILRRGPQRGPPAAIAPARVTPSPNQYGALPTSSRSPSVAQGATYGAVPQARPAARGVGQSQSFRLPSRPRGPPPDVPAPTSHSMRTEDVDLDEVDPLEFLNELAESADAESAAAEASARAAAEAAIAAEDAEAANELDNLMAQLELDDVDMEQEQEEAPNSTGGSAISSSAGSGVRSFPPSSPPLSLSESTDELARLDESCASGAITTDEYERAKTAILARAMGNDATRESQGGSRKSKRPVSERTEAKDLVEMMLAQFD